MHTSISRHIALLNCKINEKQSSIGIDSEMGFLKDKVRSDFYDNIGILTYIYSLMFFAAKIIGFSLDF